MRKISLKLKITLWYTLAMMIISGIVIVMMNSFSTQMIERDTRMRIMRTVDDMSRHLFDRSGSMHRVPDFMYYKDGVYTIIYDEAHNVLGGTLPFGISDELKIQKDVFRSDTYNGSKFYEFDREITTNQGKFFIKGIAAAGDEEYGAQSALKTNILFSLITILLAAIGGYLIISRAFVPVKKISDTAEEISKSNNLSERIDLGEGRDEIYHLANVFDKMLDKIEKSFEKEKQFTSDASHELRTPVAVIMSECEYMEECAKTADEYKESASSIKRQAKRMSKLISELLTISRMDNNKIKTSFEDVDISELVTFVCDEQEEIRDKKIALVRNISQGITAKADRFLLTRAFVNLISNAYQYIGDGDKIEVSLTSQNDKILFSVKDNGMGISEDDLLKIWDRFYQADTARTFDENGSMGLGLPMVKWIAEAHGGKVSVKSEINEGSLFTFELPLSRADS
ncbi:MAG: HAMP domain-containing histidine kinase [Firmicutes bacterium]|nr:HAMP domain-containing histidine kinase [Bacillota bacterium]